MRTGRWGRRIGAIALIGGLLLTSGCGDGGGALGPRPNVSSIDDKVWRELRSPDFVLYSNGSPEDLRLFARDLSRFIAVVDRLVDAQPPKTGATIFLLDEHGEDLFMGRSHAVGVMFTTLSGFDGLVRGVEHDPVRRGTFLHEFTHYLTLRGNLLDLPTWYTEGFAEFLETTRARGDVMEVGGVPAWRIRTLERRLARGRDIDLAQIFSFRRDGRTADPPDLYPISWATVHYLSSNAERHARMIKLLELQGRGVEWSEAYALAFDQPIEELSRRVQEHVEILLKGTPATVGYLPIEDLAVRSEFTVREVPAPEAAYLLGKLAIRGSTLRDATWTLRLAEALFAHSVALDPNDSRAQAALAFTLSLQDRAEAAEPHLAAFRADPDPGFDALIAAGHALAAQASKLPDDAPAEDAQPLWASARSLYDRALRLEPESPVAMAGVGVAMLETGEIESARATLAKAQSLGEWDATLTLERGRAEQKAGNIEAARQFYKRVIRRGATTTADRARELLRELYGDDAP